MTLAAEGEDATNADSAPVETKDDSPDAKAAADARKDDAVEDSPHPKQEKVETGTRQMFNAAKHDAEVSDPEVPAGTEMVKLTLRERFAMRWPRKCALMSACS